VPKTPPALSQLDKISVSDGFSLWLKQQKVSFAFSSYDAGCIYLIGSSDDNLIVNFINLQRAMGIAYANGKLWVAGFQHVFRFENHLANGEISNGYDAVFLPRAQYLTGNLDIHELGLDTEGNPIFAATKYSCLAGLSETKSFKHIWSPDFISKIVPEDRCHLNGVGFHNGKPRLVSYIGPSDLIGGWRIHRENGGVIQDLETGRKFNNLSMPHSPRLHSDGFIYALDSGKGHLRYYGDFPGASEIVCLCPGFLRGLSFHNDFALVTVSLPRDGVFNNLKLQDNIESRKGEAWCAVLVIDLVKCCIVHWLRFEGPTRELFDCTFLDGIQSPAAIAPSDPMIANRITWETTA
jgi:uncharacterized protein (TIGR03032 family)